MNRQQTTQARAAVAKSDDQAYMRKMEVTFLMTATVVMLTIVELIVGFHLS
jgi:hypothetical protein